MNFFSFGWDWKGKVTGSYLNYNISEVTFEQKILFTVEEKQTEVRLVLYNLLLNFLSETIYPSMTKEGICGVTTE